MDAFGQGRPKYGPIEHKNKGHYRQFSEGRFGRHLRRGLGFWYIKKLSWKSSLPKTSRREYKNYGKRLLSAFQGLYANTSRIFILIIVLRFTCGE